MKKLIIGIVALILVIVGVALYQAATPEPTAAPLTVDSASSSNPSKDHFLTLDGQYRLEDASDASRRGFTTEITAGNFADATTSVFAILNPFSATSTARVRVVGQNGTTSTDILVGTSTIGYVPGNANLSSPTLINARVATSSAFDSISGIRAGAGAGYQDPGAGSYREIVVGPSQYVVGHATSSFAAGTDNILGITNAVNTFSGSYLIEWQKPL
jgi:hypothetical protein